MYMRGKRCCERPTMYQNETYYKYESNQNDYPAAMPAYNVGMQMMGDTMAPIYECPQEQVCHKQFIHNVPHIIPVNTRIINHHIYKHSFTPCYTSCEENEVCNVYDNGCGTNL